jgi:hypothetical protein
VLRLACLGWLPSSPDIKPQGCSPTEGCHEAAAHPGDHSGVKPRPFMSKSRTNRECVLLIFVTDRY